MGNRFRFTSPRIIRLAARVFTYAELVEFWCQAMNRGDYRQAVLYVDVMDQQVREEVDVGNHEV